MRRNIPFSPALPPITPALPETWIGRSTAAGGAFMVGEGRPADGDAPPAAGSPTAEARLTVVLVDDNEADRQRLRDLLAEFAGVQVVGEASSVASAAQVIAELDPELVILDVDLPARSGFDLLPHLGPRRQVVIVTEIEALAARAFEFDVADCMLKPLRRERVATALFRVRRSMRTRQLLAATGDDGRGGGEIMVEADGTMRVVPLRDISFIKAIGNYTQLHLCSGSRLLVRRTMEAWEGLLPAGMFCRPHRSLIINLPRVRSLARRSRDETEVMLAGCETPVTVGRRASLLLHRLLRRMGRPDASAVDPVPGP